MAFTRRELLARLGLAASGSAVAACAPHPADPYAMAPRPDVRPRGWRPGREEWIPTACGQCPAGCGVKVRVFEGRAVKIEGNEECAINQGGIGPRAITGVQALYDPDRLTQPMRRKGPRGSPDFEPISWDDAQALVVERLSALRTDGRPEQLGILCGKERGMMRGLLSRFGRAFGTANVFDGWAPHGAANASASFAMQGVREVPAYDWPNTRLVLSLGTGLLGSACQMTWFARGKTRRSTWRGDIRAKIIHLEPYRSQTAANADEWIPIEPGTYGAFALALCHVLVRDGRYDEAFVAERCFGFEPWEDPLGRTHAGFKDALSAYAPAKVAGICGVPEEVIERVAADLAELRPSFALAGDLATQASNGLSVAMAVHALNTLLGALERPGGVWVQRDPPLAPWPDLEIDAIAEAGLAKGRVDRAGGERFPLAGSAVDALPAALSAGASLDTLLLYYANPLYARNNPASWRAALEKVPFVVSFSPFLDETCAEVADLVLPDDSYLERWDDAAPAPSLGFPVFGVRRPVVERLHDTRNTGDVVIALAKALPGLEASLPWPEFKAAVLGAVNSPEGKVMQKPLVQTGFWSGEMPAPEQWADAIKTPSGKVELYPQALALAMVAGGMAAAPPTPATEERADPEGGKGIPAEPPPPPGAPGAVAGLPGPESDGELLPHYEPPRWSGEPEAFPLALHAFRFNTYAEGSGANLPWLQETNVSPDHKPWETRVILHPKAAAPLQLAEGDKVRVISPTGQIEAPVRLNHDILQSVVAIAEGGGHTAFGRYAKGWGANVKVLLGNENMDPWCGASPVASTRVRLERVTS